MNDDAGAGARGAGGDRDLGQRRRAGDDMQQMRRREVAQERAAAGREDRRHAVAQQRRRGVDERVDAAVHSAQASAGDPALDPVCVDPDREQLRARDPAVLARGDPHDDVGFGAHVAQ